MTPKAHDLPNSLHIVMVDSLFPLHLHSHLIGQEQTVRVCRRCQYPKTVDHFAGELTLFAPALTGRSNAAAHPADQ